MKAASTLALLAKYKVESSRSRPRVSNDNPFIESLFKTMKYRGYMGKRQYHGSVRISVSGEVIPGAAQRGCPLYLRCSMPDLMR